MASSDPTYALGHVYTLEGRNLREWAGNIVKAISVWEQAHPGVRFEVLVSAQSSDLVPMLMRKMQGQPMVISMDPKLKQTWWSIREGK
jgi:hypothetical protein